jgi:hypothetical protein
MSTGTPSICSRCGAGFGCAMQDGSAGPCWCTTLPPVVPGPLPSGAQDGAPGCWCPVCLRQHIAQRAEASPDTPAAA